MESLLLSADSLATALEISKASVWGWLSSGRLPAPIKLGKSTRWRREEIEAWVAAGCPGRDRWEAMRNAGA